MLPADNGGQVWPVGAALWEDGPFSAGGLGDRRLAGETGNSLSVLPLFCSRFSSDCAGAIWKLDLSLGWGTRVPGHPSGDRSPEDQSSLLATRLGQLHLWCPSVLAGCVPALP